MNQDELLNKVWNLAVIEYTKEWFITEGEITHLKNIFNKLLLEAADVELKSSFKNE